jgi:hypothetical protein
MSAPVTRNSPRLISLLVLLMLLIIISLVFLSIVFKYGKEKRTLQSLLRVSLSDVVDQYEPIMSNFGNFNTAMNYYLPLQDSRHTWSDEDNLIRNGSFSNNREGFKSEINSYELNKSLITMPHRGGTAGVVTDVHSLHWNWYGEPMDKGGKMFLVDGAEDSNKVVWSQNVNVKPNKKYIFQFHLCNISIPDNSQKHPVKDNRWQRALVQPVINGKRLPASFVPSTVKQWQAYRITWESGDAATAEIQLFDRNTSGLFNDFGLDMISLTEATEENLKLAGPLADTVVLTPYSFREEEDILKFLFYDYFEYRKAEINFSVFMIETKTGRSADSTVVHSTDTGKESEYLKTISEYNQRGSFHNENGFTYTSPVLLRNNVFLVLRINNMNRFLYGLVVEEFFLFIIIIFIAVIMYILIIRFLKSNQELTMLKYTIIRAYLKII